MRLFQVVLFCGALLGAVKADSTTRVGEVNFQSRIAALPSGVVPNQLHLRATYFDAKTRNDAASYECSSASFTPSYDGGKAYYFKTIYLGEVQDGFIAYNVDTTQTYAQTSPTATAASTSDGFEDAGRYKLCGCFGADCQNAFSTTTHKYDFGWLHVVDSVSLVGPHAIQNNFYSALDAKVPSVILQASIPDGAQASVQASWLMKSVTPFFGISDQFMVIDTSSKVLLAPALGGWQCGNTHWDGNLTDSEITVLSEGLVVDTDVSGCTTEVVNGKPGVDSGTCSNQFLRESAAFTAPGVNSTSFSTGFLCFCDFKANGQCSERGDFGAALGPIVFRQFYVSEQQKHYTVQSAKDQDIAIAARSDVNFTLADALGLVRQDSLTAAETGAYSYSHSHSRGCGWSNLDIEPTLGQNPTSAEYQFSQFDVATSAQVNSGDSRETSVATYRLDFAGVHTRRYELCMCQNSFMSFDSTPASAYDDRLSIATALSFGTGCPKPAVPNGDDNNNFKNSFFNLFYAQSAGVLHVVNLLSPINVMLQAGTHSHLSANMMSRKASEVSGRTADHVFYQANHAQLLKSRFYITNGECGTDAFDSGSLTQLGQASDMYIRVRDAFAGVTGGAQSFAKDSIFDETDVTWTGPGTAPPKEWSALWSLTTGWEMDSFKPLGGSGAKGSSGKSQDHSRSQGRLLYPTADAVGVALSLCYCDQTTEFSADSTESCSTRAAARDYSNFKATAGSVTVGKFVFNNIEAPKHYTVFQAADQSFTMAVPAASDSTEPVVSKKDKLMIIPAYGDGYGIDDDKPAVYLTTSGGTQSDKVSDPTSATQSSSNKPWKTTYTCGQDHSGTKRTLAVADQWLEFPARPEISVASASSTEVATKSTTFVSDIAFKYKICYCSDAFGACPVNTGGNGELGDAANNNRGFINAHRYSDFAGYLHVVYSAADSVLPLFAVTNPDYWALRADAQTAIITNFATSDLSSEVAFLFAEDLAGACGAFMALGSGTTLLDPDSTNKIDNADDNRCDIASPRFSDRPRVLDLQICMCSAVAERLEEYVKAVPSSANVFNSDMAECKPAQFERFGASTGEMRIREFVVPQNSVRHFTITGMNDVQTFDITDINSAAEVVTAAVSGDDASADHVGFLDMQSSASANTPLATQKECGADALEMSTAVASQVSTTLTTSAINYRTRFGLNPQKLVRVCYCQVSLYNGQLCDGSIAEVWTNLGFLHMVDMAVWPQSFIMRSGWKSEDSTLSNPYSVKFNAGAEDPGSGSSFAISGADTNPASTAVYTYRCGGTSEYTGSTALAAADYKRIFTSSAPDKDVQVLDNVVTVTSFDTQNTTIAFEPAGNSAHQTLGVNNFKYVCMCDTNEIRPDGAASSTFSTSTPPPCYGGNQKIENADTWSNFGITVGKVYFAKTLTLAGFVGNNDYYSQLHSHYTLSRATAGRQSFTIQGATIVTDKQDFVHAMDTIGFLETSQTCGTDMPFETGTVTPTQAGAFTGSVDADVLARITDAFAPPQASKFYICLCRHQVLGACTDANAFFETVGWMHIVNMIPEMFGASFPLSSNTEVTISLTFADNLFNAGFDRFAVVANGGDCGQYKVIEAPAGQSASYSGYADGLKYEVAVGYDGADQFLLSTVASSSPTVTKYQTAKLRFAGQGTFSLCYCAYSAEDGCPVELGSSPSTVDVLDYYTKFGATLGTVKIMTFLTDIDDEAFTIYATEGASGAQIGISKTSAEAVLIDFDADKWALVSSTASCGLETADVVTSGLFVQDSIDDFRHQGDLAACEITDDEDPEYECTTFYTNANRDLFVGLAPGKYKLCLCSADGFSCDASTGTADFGDQAGFVHVLAGNATVYQEQTVMVDALDTDATVSFDFGPGQVLSDADRFTLVHASFRCGDERTPAEQVYSSTTFDNVTYTVVSNSLTTAPLGFSTPGVYKVCYCSAASEGDCPDSQGAGMASYGAEIGRLIVNDFKFGGDAPGSTNQWTVTQDATASLTLHYSSDFVSCACLSDQCTAQIKFVALDLPCDTATGANATALVNLASSGVAMDVDFSNIFGTRTFYRACMSTPGGTRPLDFNGVGVFVSDVTLSPKTTVQALVPVTLSYTQSLVAGQDSFWFRHADISCVGAPSTATANSTAMHKVVASSVAVADVDFTQMAASDDYRLCVGSNCDGTACLTYLDFRATRMSVYKQLTVFPKAVPTAADVAVTIKFDANALAGYRVWFQSAELCAYPSDGATTSSSDAFAIDAAPINFDFATVTSSQEFLHLCAAESSTATPLHYGPAGLRVIKLKVDVPAVSQGHHEVKITSDALAAGDQLYFLDTSIACSPVLPSVGSATSTQAVTIESGANPTIEFDFSLMTSVSRVCIVPTGSPETVIDLDIDPLNSAAYETAGLQPRITVRNLSLSRTSVRTAADQKITITYGPEALNGTTGQVWFEQTTCSSAPVASTTSSSVSVLELSGREVAFDFSTVTPSQDPFTLCFMATGAATATTLSSASVIATTISVSPRSVVRDQAVSLVIEDRSDDQFDQADKGFFLQSSVSCSAVRPANTFSEDFEQGEDDGNGRTEQDVNFATAAVSSSPYRLCLRKALGRIIDLDVVELFVIDALVRPNVVEQKDDATVVFSNRAESGAPDEKSLAAGDVVWFVQATGCGTSAPTAAGAATTDAVQLTAGLAQAYPFDFSRAGQTNDDAATGPIEPFSLCVLRSSGEIRAYESIKVWASLNKISPELVLSIDTTNGGLDDIEFTKADNGPLLTEGDYIAFVSVTSACDFTEKTNTTAAVDRTPWKQLGAGSSDFEEGKLDFSELSSSNLRTPLRMCAYSESLSEGFDLSWVKFSILRLTLDPLSNPAYTGKSTVRFQVAAGLNAGDEVALAADCTTDPTKQTVPSIIQGVVQMDFTIATAAGGLDLCIGPSNIRAGIKLLVIDTGVATGLLRQGDDMKTVIPAGGIGARDILTSAVTGSSDTDQFFLASSGDSCDTNVNETNALRLGATDQQNQTVSLSNTLLSACVVVGEVATPFGNLGVVVSDLQIMNSDATSTASIGSVAASAGQDVTFQTSNPFNSTSKLYFVLSTKACGVAAEAIPGVDRSDAVAMPATAPSPWSLKFNFSAATPGISSVFRLCVETAPGNPILDFKPLGVRVADITFTPASMQPAADTSIIVGLPSDASAGVTEVRFVSIGSTDCGTDAGVTWNDNVDALSFNLAPLASNEGAVACLKVAGTWELFSSAVIRFDAVTVSPASVPANAGQKVKFAVPGKSLEVGDEVRFLHSDVACNSGGFVSDGQASRTATVTAFDDQNEVVLAMNFTGMYVATDFDARLCVHTKANNANNYLELPSVTITVSAPVVAGPAVGIAGDPHVRSSSGAWLDFYGEAGVYELLSGDIQANARFGYAVRDNFMIWHPKVMRPGTLVEEVGIQLKDTQTSLRLGIQGGGIVSLRQGLQSTDFWAGTEERAVQVGDYSISWSACERSCEAVLPWGTHHRSKTLTIEGRGEYLQMHISKSGGYRFIDVEAIPSSSSTGLLADAAMAPAELATHLLSGNEAVYSASTSMLKA